MDDATLVQLCSPRFRRLARCFRLPRYDVDDLIQETWLHILENRGRIALAKDVLAYAEQVLRNAARSSRRQGLRRGDAVSLLHDQDPSDERPNPEACLMARQRSDVLWGWLETLDDPLRVVFIEGELLGMTFAEIAKAHELPESTVKERYYSAWSKVEQQKVQWQAKQRGRGEATALCFVPLFSHDHMGDVLRAIRRFWFRASASVAIVLVMGSFPPAEHGGGCNSTPWVPQMSRVESLVIESPSPIAEERGMTSKGSMDAVDVQDSAPTVMATSQDSPVAASAETAAVTASTEDGSGTAHAIHAIESTLLARARAMVNLGTMEGQLMACRLLNEHRERYGRGPLAPQRDALFRRVRCEHNALTDTSTAKR